VRKQITSQARWKRAKIGQNAKQKICRPNGRKKSQQNANKPNTKSTGQTAFKKAKFELFGLEKCQMATLIVTFYTLGIKISKSIILNSLTQQRIMDVGI